MRASEDNMIASAQRFADQQKAAADAHIKDYDRRMETWKPTLQAYVSCNRSASRAVAPQTGDPVSLAVAARNLCRTSEANLRKAIYAAYEDNPTFGIETMDKTRRSILENNTGDIVAARAAATATPRRPPEPAPPPVDTRI
jgi:hypothetical protein